MRKSILIAIQPKHLSGFTLIEVVIAVTLLGAVLAAFFVISSSIGKQSASGEALGDMEKQLGTLAKEIVYFGATAGDSSGAVCSAPKDLVTNNNTIIQCNVLRKVTGVPTLVVSRYYWTQSTVAGQNTALAGSNPGQIIYQEQDAASNFQTKAIYTNILSFAVCDLPMMQAGTCSILPAMTSLNAAQVAAGASGRYFRFQIIAQPPGQLDLNSNQKVAGALSQALRIQGAFYARNPFPPPFGNYNLVSGKDL